MKRTLLIILSFLLVYIFTALASDQIPAPPQQQPIALTGGTIHPVVGEPIENGTIVFDKGKIIAIGTQVELPDNCRVISVEGLHVYPVLIAANTVIGLVEIPAVRATRDFAEVGEIKPNVRAETAINPDSEIIPVTRANGIGLALSVPQGGLISGTSALIMLDGWTWEQMTLKAPVALHVRWPSMAIRKGPRVKQSPAEQQKAIDAKIQKIRQAFADARAYWKAKQAEKTRGIPYHDTDSRWEAMIPVLKGEVPVFVHANTVREMKAAIAWAEEEGIQLVIVGGYDAWRIADELKERNIPVIIAGIHRLPLRRWEAYDTPFSVAAKLSKAGVKFCIATEGSPFGAAHERNLPYHAATAAAYGLPREEALKAVTLYAAEILGVADRVGSLEVGKDATLMVTTGDPLEITTQVKQMFLQGRQIDLSSRHTQLYQKYLEKYRQLHLIPGE